MANDMRYLSAEEEAKLLKPIDEYVGKIQAQIDALRVDGSDQVQALKTHISLTKEDKNYTKEEQNEIIRKDQALLVKDEVTGREVLRYGGDFDDRPSDYEFSGNGIVFADRREKPAMQEVRYYYGMYI